MDLSRGALDLTGGKRYPLDGSEIPFPDLDSVLALLPAYAQGDDAGGMRDAVLMTIAALANKVWADTGIQLNAFISPRFSEGAMLDGHWGVALKRPRLTNETDGPYRLRLLAVTDGITPDAIKTAILAAAADFNTTVDFLEPANDGLFIGGDDPDGQAWFGFAQPDAGILWSKDPLAVNPTTGAFVSSDTPGAQFWVLMLAGSGSDDQALVACADNDVTSKDGHFFVSDGTVDWAFVAFDGDPLELRITAEANARKAFGISWLLLESPYLNGAV